MNTLRKIALTLACLLLATPAWAGIAAQLDTGQTLYVHVKTGAATYVHCQILDAGGTGWYHCTDAQLVTAGLTTDDRATIFTTGFPFVVTTSATLSTNPLAGGSIDWDGSAERLTPTATQITTGILGTTTTDTGAGTIGRALHNLRQYFGTVNTGVASVAGLANAPAGGGGGSFIAVSPDVVDASRTWNGEGARALNIITVGDNFTGTLALKPDMNNSIISPEAGSVTATITGAATVTPASYSVNRDFTKGHITVPTLTTTGTYTVTVTVETVDGQTIPTTCTLKVQ